MTESDNPANHFDSRYPNWILSDCLWQLIFRNGAAYESRLFILFSFFLDDFVVLFDQFGEIPSDELPERAVVEPEPPGQRLDAFGGRGVQAEGLAVFLRAVMCHDLTVVRPDHTQPGV